MLSARKKKLLSKKQLGKAPDKLTQKGQRFVRSHSKHPSSLPESVYQLPAWEASRQVIFLVPASKAVPASVAALDTFETVPFLACWRNQKKKTFLQMLTTTTTMTEGRLTFFVLLVHTAWLLSSYLSPSANDLPRTKPEQFRLFPKNCPVTWCHLPKDNTKNRPLRSVRTTNQPNRTLFPPISANYDADSTTDGCRCGLKDDEIMLSGWALRRGHHAQQKLFSVLCLH